MREVRMALEGLAAEKPAPLITSDEIVVVESHYHALAAGASAGNPIHTGIYRPSRSRLLVSLIEPTWMRIGPHVRLMLPDRRALIDSLGNHQRALQALRQREGVGAREAIQRESSSRRKDWRACCRRAKELWACVLRAVNWKGAAGCEEAPSNGRDGASQHPLAVNTGRRERWQSALTAT
jgi:DNA-binding GntR family transcriptional regulator